MVSFHFIFPQFVCFMTFICAHCSHPSKFKCARCLSTRYCGRECQRAHHALHKAECAAVLRDHKALVVLTSSTSFLVSNMFTISVPVPKGAYYLGLPYENPH